jgi:hypothetical protein
MGDWLGSGLAIARACAVCAFLRKVRRLRWSPESWLRCGPTKMAAASAANACSGAAATADGSGSTAVALALGNGAAGLDSEAAGAVTAGASVPRSLLHPASQGTASVGAARPRPMTMRRDNWAGWTAGAATSHSATRRRYLTRAVCCRTRAAGCFPCWGRHNRRT